MTRIAPLIFAACLLLTFAAQWAAADPVQWATNGHWYEAVTSSPLTWEQAGQAAVAMSWMGMSGHLATITSQAEGDFLSSVMPAGYYWLAAYQDPWDSPPDQNWHWPTAEPWSYTNWAPREPNDYYGRALDWCLEWYGPGLGWNDVTCYQAKAFLVEYDGITPVAAPTWGAIKALFGPSPK